MEHVSSETGNACYHSGQNYSLLILPKIVSI